jgi:hypothetical protein
VKNNFIDDLIHAVDRVVKPNVGLLKEVLVIGGMPEPTQNLRYLSYNRHTTLEGDRSYDFCAVAVINNRRAEEWQLTGYSKKISRWVFSTRWTRNPLDLYLCTIRCDPSVMAVLAGAASHYSLLGILTINDLHRAGLTRKRAQHICPVVAVPGIDADELKTIQAYEAASQIRRSGLIGVQFYRKAGRQMAGV